MEWISHEGKWYIFTFKQYQQLPKIRVKDRISTSNIEIRHSIISFTEILAVCHYFLHLLPGHTLKLFAAFS
jgi:hypothetical protein